MSDYLQSVILLDSSRITGEPNFCRRRFLQMMNEESIERVSPFACRMDAIEADKRPEHIATARHLFSLVGEIKELPDGYAFRLPVEAEVLLKVAEFISLERLCCPFFGFTLEIEREGGDVWLHLTGREGVKPFIRAEIGEFMSGADGFMQPDKSTLS